MPALITVPLCLALLLTGAAVHADAQGHLQAARNVYEASKPPDTTSLAGAVAEMIMQIQPDWRAQRDVVEQYALEIVTSEAFDEANVRVIAELFTQEELESLVWLFRHSAYQRYRAKSAELVRRSTQATMSLFRDSLPELERRIEARRGR